jgi:hypothetical protein
MTEHTILLVGNDHDVRAHLAFLDTEVIRVEDIEQADAFLNARDHDHYLVIVAPDVMRDLRERPFHGWDFAVAVGETVSGVPGWLWTAALITGARSVLELPTALPWLADTARHGWPALAA